MNKNPVEAPETSPAEVKPVSIDGLLDSYAPLSDTFEITLTKGEKLKAKLIMDASEWLTLEKRVAEMQETVNKSPHPSWRPFLPASEHVVRLATYCEELLVEPKMGFGDALRIAKSRGGLFFQIANKLLDAVGEFIDGEAKAVEGEKKDS